MPDPKISKSKALISIVYHSGSGHTAEMARAVAKGVSSVRGVSVAQHRILDQDFKGSRRLNEEVLKQLDESDAIILGSPTYKAWIVYKIRIAFIVYRPRANKVISFRTCNAPPSFKTQ